MTFPELLRAKDEKIARLGRCVEEEAKAQEALTAAQEALARAEAATAAAEAEKTEAHRAIHDLLAEKGEHYDVANDGTFTVYRVVDAEPGWCAYQPIPGTTPPTAGA